MKTLTTLFLALILAVAAPGGAYAQEEVAETYTQAELDQMLAPIALYPDTVLSHVLIGATYPLEIIQAYRWSQDHPDLNGTEAVDAVEMQDWDPSVKALVAFPEILRRMHDDLAWTQRLGEAFLMQEEEVVATVQDLRERAYAAGNLRSDDHVEVVRENNVIVVEPARPEVIYVPYYDPRVVYGRWWWSAYPPVYWSHPPGFHVSVNYWWGHGYRITPSWFYISSFHWTRRHVVVIHHHHYKRPRHHFRSGRELVRYDGVRRWSHNPHHRRGAGYRAQRLNDRYVRGGHYRDGQRQRGDNQVVHEGRENQRRQQVDFQRPQRVQRQEQPRQDFRQSQQRQDRRRGDAQQVQQRPQRVQRQEQPRQDFRQSQQRQDRRRGDAQQVQQRPLREQRQQPQVQRPQRVERQEPQFQRPQRVERQEPQVQRPQRVERQQPQVQRPQRVERQQPQVQRPQRVERQEPQVQRPQRVERREPQVQRPQRVERQQPQVQRQSPQVQRRPESPARRESPAQRERRNAPERTTEQDR